MSVRRIARYLKLTALAALTSFVSIPVHALGPAPDPATTPEAVVQVYGARTMGVKGIKLTARRGYVVAAFMVGLEDEVVLISSAGVTIRLPVREISSQGRDATGVRVMNLEAGQTVASVAPILASDDDD